MRIEEIKNSLSTVRAELNKEREKGIALSKDANAGMDELTAQMNVVERLKAQETLLAAQLENAEAQQAEGAKKNAIADDDAIRNGAKAFKNMGDFFAAVASGRNPRDARLAEYAGIRAAATGQNLTTDADGGYLVPPDYSAELLKFAQSESVLYPKVRKAPISGNRLIEPYIVQEKRGDTSTAGNVTTYGRNGVIAYWKGEAEQYLGGKMQFGQIETRLEKLTGMAYATDEMLQDMPALGAIIADGFRDEFAFKIDDAILNGSGATNSMPIGILDSANAALVTIAKETNQPAATIQLANILKMFNAMPARHRANAEFYINQDLEIQLMQMLMNIGSVESTGASAVEAITASFGKPIYMPAGGLTNAPNGLLLGRPIVPVEQCSALGTKGDILFADLSQYRWIDKGGINAQTSIHVRFDYDETCFKFSYRCGGRPIWKNSIAAYKGSSVRSPYVALATRS